MSNHDEKTIKLIQEIKRRKEEIASAERPNWITNCSFSYEEGSSNTVNLHVESNVGKLLKIGAFLTLFAEHYAGVAAELKVDSPPEFVWAGYSVDDWLHDIKIRIDKLQITAKRKKLESLEARVNSIISPVLRAEMELAAIEAELES